MSTHDDASTRAEGMENDDSEEIFGGPGMVIDFSTPGPVADEEDDDGLPPKPTGDDPDYVAKHNARSAAKSKREEERRGRERRAWYKAELARFHQEWDERTQVEDDDPYPEYLEPWAYVLITNGVVQVPSFRMPVKGETIGTYKDVPAERFTLSEFRSGVRRHFRLSKPFDIGDWSEFSDEERDMVEHLDNGGYLELVELPAVADADALILPPTRRAYEAALRECNPNVNIYTVSNPIVGDCLMLQDSAHYLTCPLFLEGVDCAECTEEGEREEGGRGLAITNKTLTFFGPRAGGKTWLEVAAAKEAIAAGRNVLHYEADDDVDALPKRLILAGVSPLDVVRHVRVIHASEIQVTGEGSKRRPVTPDIPEAFARLIRVVSLDAVISMAGKLRLDSTAATLAWALTDTLLEPFYRRSKVGAYGILVDHSGLQNLDRPMDSSQKDAAVSLMYQVRTIKPMGVGRVGGVELILRKDRHSIHIGKSEGDVVGYMILDGRGEKVDVELCEQHPDKRSSTPTKRGKSRVSEVKTLIHEWLMENVDNATATQAEIWDGLRGTIKASGKRLTNTDVNNNLNRLTADDPIRALSDGRYRAL